MKNIIHNLRFIYDTMEKKRKYIFLAIIHVLLGISLPFGIAQIPKLVTQINNASREFVCYTIIFVATIKVLQWIDLNFNLQLNKELMIYRYTLGSRLMKCSLRRDIKEIDSSYGKKQAELARRAIYEGNYVGIEIYLRSLNEIVLDFFALVIETLIILKYNIFLSILILFISILIVIIQNKDNKEIDDVQNELGNNFCALRDLYSTSVDRNKQNDIWLYGMKRLFSRKFDLYRNLVEILERKIEKKFNHRALWQISLTLLRDAIVYITLLFQLKSNMLVIGELVFLLLIIENCERWMEDLADNYQEIIRNGYLVNALRNFLTSPKELPATTSSMRFTKTIEFQDVYFKYDDTKDYVIKDMNLTINCGEKIAITGMNGAGKSTLIKLLTGAYKPSKGQILVDGKNATLFSWNDYKELFAVMNQQSTILPFTIAENITATEEKDIEYGKLNKAAYFSGIDNLIKNLKLGYHTSLTRQIDRDGVMLSGGEKQKILIARTLYADRDILVFDEPTASLDALSEEKMYLQLSDMTKDKTCIFISHRLISTKFCDKIIFIENGKILEAGTHDELMNKKGRYAFLFEEQGKRYYDESH